MDLNNLQLALPSQSSSSNSGSSAEYSFASPRPQNFSLPYPIIKYMFTNPNSGTAWKKLIQTCKYFFSKNSIFPVERLTYDDDKWNADGKVFDSAKTIVKLWIYEEIVDRCFDDQRTRLSSFIPKIYKCDLRSLDIWCQNLTLQEYQFLTSSSSFEKLSLCYCKISHSDGTLVTFDRLFENVLQLQTFEMRCDENSATMFEKDTVKNLADILPRLKSFSWILIYGLTETFDFDSITDFLLKNETIHVSFEYDAVLSDGYKEYLEKCIAKIIETPPKRIPNIDFPGFENSIYYDDYKNLF